MFELLAKKRVIDGVGDTYHKILEFEREEQKYYMMDKIDRDKYQEAIIMEGNRLVMYREFEEKHIIIRSRRKR